MVATQKSILFGKLKQLGNPRNLKYSRATLQQVSDELAYILASQVAEVKAEVKAVPVPRRRVAVVSIRSQLWNELKALGNPRNLKYSSSGTAVLSRELERIRTPAQQLVAVFVVAHFQIQIMDGKRRADTRDIRAFQEVSVATVQETKRQFSGGPLVMSADRTGPIAERWGFINTHNNVLSAGGLLSLLSLNPVDGKHEIGAFDLFNHGLTATAENIQPTIGDDIGKYFKYGAVCRGEYWRADSCVISLFMEYWAGKLPKLANMADARLCLETLYKIATDLDLIEGQPAPVSLNQCRALCDTYKIGIRALDNAGKLIFMYDSPKISKKIVGGSIWYILVHDSHIWNITAECLPSVQAHCKPQISRGLLSQIQNAVESDDISAKIIPEFKHPPAPDGLGKVFVHSVADILTLKVVATPNGPPNMETTVVCSGGLKSEQCMVELWRRKLLPAYISMHSGIVSSFTIRLPNMLAVRVIDSAKLINAGDQIVADSFNSFRLTKFENELYKLRKHYMPRAGLSHYSDSLRDLFGEYSRGARQCSLRFDNADTLTEIDIQRAYTSAMLAIDKIPVFSVFDVLRPLTPLGQSATGVLGARVADNAPKLNLFAFYLITVEFEHLDAILFPQMTDFVIGSTLAYADSIGRPYTIVGVVEPSIIHKLDTSNPIHDLYNDPDVSDADRKNIVNIIYGNANTGKKTKQIAKAFGNIEDARVCSTDGGYRVPISDVGFIAVRSGSAQLNSGYLPLARIILESNRVLLHRMATATNAIAVNVDCIYISAESDSTATAIKQLKSVGFAFFGDGYTKIGKLRVGTKPNPKYMEYKRHMNPLNALPIPLPYKICNRIELVAEMATTLGDWSEVDDIIARSGNVALEGRVPGSGKTHLALEYIRRHGLMKSHIIVAPWNTLVADITAKGFNSMTLHKLLGKSVEADEAKADEAKAKDETKAYAKKGANLDDIIYIYFDEAYLYNIVALGWIAKFIRTVPPTIQFMMAGDPGQLTPINQNLAVDAGQYYENIFAELFPTRIVLCQSKRITDPLERTKMVELCDMLADSKTAPATILAEFKHVRFEDLTADDFKFQHISAINTTRDNVNNRAHSLLGKPLYEIGQTLLGTGSYAFAGGVIRSNEPYKVVAINEACKMLTVSCNTSNTVGGTMFMTFSQASKWLRYGYCRSCHSVQGLTYNDRIYIHNTTHSMATKIWLRTAVSRCTSLNIIIVQ